MSTKGKDTSMKEKKGIRSPTLPQKARVGQQQETTRRSPSLPRKTETGQRGRSLTPSSILERKKTSTLLESRKVPTIPWPLATPLSRGPSARNPKKPVSSTKTKSVRQSLDRPTPPSKVMSTKSKSNPKNITTSSTKTSGSVKPNKVSTTSRSPLKLKNSVNVKATNAGGKKQTKNDLGSMAFEKKPIMSSSQNDLNIVAHEEHNHILHGEVNFEDRNVGLVGDHDMAQSRMSCDDNVSVDKKLSYDHDDGHINQQDDQSEEITFDIMSDHPDHSLADQENQEPESEQVEHEGNVGSTNENGEFEDEEDIEETDKQEQESEEGTILEEGEHEEMKHVEHEETDIEEEEEDERKQEMEEDDEVPEDEDTRSKVVMKSPEVVMHGKKDSATYNDVIEETVSKLREQRKNRVLALAGAFETVISLESDVSPKDLSPRNI